MGTAMGTASKRLALRGAAVVTASAWLCSLPALGASGNPASDARARYEQERAACDANAATQDRAACLRETAAAFEAARRTQLDAAASASEHERNALRRCEMLPEPDRPACQARVRGQGTERGSVAEGGIYREYREIVIPRDEAPATGAAGGSSVGTGTTGR